MTAIDDTFAVKKSFKSVNHLTPASSTLEKFQLSNFIKTYFDFTYYLAASPFRIIRTNKDDQFTLRVWIPQQIVCGIGHVLLILRLVTEVRLAVAKGINKTSKNPVSFFKLFLRLFNFGLKAVAVKRYWLNQEDFLNVLNYINYHKDVFRSNLWIQKKWLIFTIFAICSVHYGVSNMIVGKHFIKNISNWSPSEWVGRLVVLSRYTFFIGKLPEVVPTPKSSDITGLDIFLSVLNVFGLYQRNVAAFYSGVYVLVSALTLWTATNSFAKRIQADLQNESKCYKHKPIVNKMPSSASDAKREKITWTGIYGHFKVILELSEVINESLGQLVTLFLGESIMFYSIHLDEVFIIDDMYERIQLIISYCILIGTLFTSADICYKMETVEAWIGKDENRKTVPVDELAVVLREMDTKNIGIRGGNRFTITYSMLAGFISLVITYFIICVQYE